MAHNYTLKEGTPEYVGDILSALETQSRLNETWQRCFEAYKDELGKVWKDNAELRDELHAVANRLENLTRAVTTSPAEVAAAIVNDANRETLRAVPYPMCRCGHRHDHHRHHEPGKGCYDCDSCRGYNPWPIEAVDRG